MMLLFVIGMMALSGTSIPATMYAVAVVFILPVNSALNPILYTISSINLKVNTTHSTAALYYHTNNIINKYYMYP